MNFNKIALTLLFATALTGCISPKTYVDPAYSKATYNDIKAVSDPYASNLVIEFQRNGEHFQRADKELRKHVERVLQQSGVITLGPDTSPYSLKVVVNNIADMGDAAAKGFATGLTFGAAGTLVTDYYEATFEFTDKDGKAHTGSYKHALHTTIGNQDAPFENVQSVTPAGAFGIALEQMLLNFLKEMQDQGVLSLNPGQLESMPVSG